MSKQLSCRYGKGVPWKEMFSLLLFSVNPEIFVTFITEVVI